MRSASLASVLLLASAVPAIAGEGLHASPDGTCGKGTGFTCKQSFYGGCCNADGKCGSTAPYCGSGCQSAYGYCKSDKDKRWDFELPTYVSPVKSSKSSASVYIPTPSANGSHAYAKPTYASTTTVTSSSPDGPWWWPFANGFKWGGAITKPANAKPVKSTPAGGMAPVITKYSTSTITATKTHTFTSKGTKSLSYEVYTTTSLCPYEEAKVTKWTTSTITATKTHTFTVKGGSKSFSYEPYTTTTICPFEEYEIITSSAKTSSTPAAPGKLSSNAWYLPASPSGVKTVSKSSSSYSYSSTYSSGIKSASSTHSSKTSSSAVASPVLGSTTSSSSSKTSSSVVASPVLGSTTSSSFSIPSASSHSLSLPSFSFPSGPSHSFSFSSGPSHSFSFPSGPSHSFSFPSASESTSSSVVASPVLSSPTSTDSSASLPTITSSTSSSAVVSPVLNSTTSSSVPASSDSSSSSWTSSAVSDTSSSSVPASSDSSSSSWTSSAVSDTSSSSVPATSDSSSSSWTSSAVSDSTSSSVPASSDSSSSSWTSSAVSDSSTSSSVPSITSTWSSSSIVASPSVGPDSTFVISCDDGSNPVPKKRGIAKRTIGYVASDGSLVSQAEAALFSITSGALRSGSSWVGVSGSSATGPFQLSPTEPAVSTTWVGTMGGAVSFNNATFCKTESGIVTIVASGTPPSGCTPVSLTAAPPVSSTSSSSSVSVTSSASDSSSSVVTSSASGFPSSSLIVSPTFSNISVSSTASSSFSTTSSVSSFSANATISSSTVTSSFSFSANATISSNATITSSSTFSTITSSASFTISNSMNATSTTASNSTSSSSTTTSTCSTAPTLTAGFLPNCIPCDGQPGNDQFCGFDINTNSYENTPKTCRVVTYEFDITETTASPDGVSRMVMLVNGQQPGPAIKASWGDTVVVKVNNLLSDNGTSIHFHGIRQLDNNMNDGVPSITQCPIAPGQSMTYTWVAENYGTSWYHSHFAIQAWEGVLGPMIIDGPHSADFDVDLGTFIVQDWSHFTVDSRYDLAENATPIAPNSTVTFGGPVLMDNGLINGQNIWLGDNQNSTAVGSRLVLPTFVPGTKYLFRFINTAIQSTFKLYLDGHTFTVISTDFVPITPYTTNILNINIGQRYNVIVEADQPVDSYFLRADIQTACAGTVQALDIRAIVNYEGSTATVPTSTAYNYTGECVDEPVASLVPVVPLTVGAADFTEGTLDVVIHGNEVNLFKWYLSGTTFFSEYNEPTLLDIWENKTLPTFSGNLLVELPNAKEWVYVIVESPIPLPHPLHLHGHDFFILAEGAGSYDSSVVLNLANPPRRDTALLPAAGFIVLAFETDNPGVWLMHCHIGWHTSMGFALQFVEMQSQIASSGALNNSCTLNGTCNSWIDYATANSITVLDSGV